jgi:hypothetical protein
MNILPFPIRPWTLIQFLKFPLIVLAFHIILAGFLQIYESAPWFDMPMHYLGGLSVTYSLWVILTYLQEEKIINQLGLPITLLFSFSLLITIAVFWEFGEFLLDRLLGINLQVSLPNTMRDLAAGMSGAVTVLVYFSWKAIRQQTK